MSRLFVLFSFGLYYFSRCILEHANFIKNSKAKDLLHALFLRQTVTG